MKTFKKRIDHAFFLKKGHEKRVNWAFFCFYVGSEMRFFWNGLVTYALPTRFSLTSSHFRGLEITRSEEKARPHLAFWAKMGSKGIYDGGEEES